MCSAASTSVFSGSETRQWLAWCGAGQLQQGDAFRQSWLDNDITEDEIQQTLLAVEKWAETEDAWYAAIQCDLLAWKYLDRLWSENKGEGGQGGSLIASL